MMDEISQHMVASFSWHSVEFGLQAWSALLLTIGAIGLAVGMKRRAQNAVFLSFVPFGTWFVVDRVATSDWLIAAATWGLTLGLAFVVATLIAGVRERVAVA
jgi:hypothetical protein